MKKITYKDNSKEYIRQLKKVHGGLPTVASETVNTAAKLVDKTYKKELDRFTLRNKFTKRGVKTLLSRPTSRGGDFRPIGKINAIVGVLKMKGGKKHYLTDQEKGDVKTGKVKGKVPIPIDKNARTAGAYNRPVKSALRLGNSTQIQTLKIGSENLGVNDRFNARGGKQRWAILYRGMRSNKWDLSKQFFFTSINKGLGIFKKVGNKIKKTRSLEESNVKIKATHKLQRATEKLTPNMMKAIFKREAEKKLRGK